MLEYRLQAINVNRRWAKQHKMPFIVVYKRGIDKIEELITWVKEKNIANLSIWGFSTENFSRETMETKALLQLFSTKISEALKKPTLRKNKIRVRFFGKRSLFSPSLQKQMTELENATRDFNGLNLNIFLGYGGRQEILDACIALSKDLSKKTIRTLTPQVFSNYLYTRDLPDPDLVVRTSGEKRLSGFMPWQTVYSELFFYPRYWPDFSKKDFQKILEEYRQRQRRFGK